LRDFADLGSNNGQTNKGRPYCQQQNCSSLKLYFSAMYAYVDNALRWCCWAFLHYGPAIRIQ